MTASKTSAGVPPVSEPDRSVIQVSVNLTGGQPLFNLSVKIN